MIEEKLKLLKEVGFTDSEIKFYTSLLSLGKTDSKTISKKANIPIARVYSIAEKLAEKGLVRMLPGHPSMFEATSPSEGFSKLLEKIELKKRKIESLVTEFQKIFYERKEEEEEILLYKDFNVIKKEILESNLSSKREICMYSKFTRRDEEILESLERLVKRKVKVRVTGAV
ncbi:MAG: TrmB family transcriptional regulator, partial [Candidatus Micrarchaeia archaeon]